MAEIFSSKDRQEGKRYSVKIDRLFKIEVFFDRRMVEVFLNNGEYVGTRLFYTLEKIGKCRIETGELNNIKRLELRKMKSIWRK